MDNIVRVQWIDVIHVMRPHLNNELQITNIRTLRRNKLEYCLPKQG